MSLAATLAADGMRPASFLPTITCSSCGDEIAISAMAEHQCARVSSSPKTAPASLSNPFTLRQLNATGTKLPTPSPLQYNSHPPQHILPPQTRVRAPTLGSGPTSTQRPFRPPPPRINPDAANQPFLAPAIRSESPISPALSTRSGSSNGSRPAVLRSATQPMPRLWDPRPPSPELSANLDCAFPPFPAPSGAGTGSRPGTSSGRKTPTSDRAPSRSGSRQEGKWPIEREPFNLEPKSPMSNAGQNMLTRMDTMSSGPFDASGRRPSRDEKSQQAPPPLDRRRPSLPRTPAFDEPPPLPTNPMFSASQIPRPSTSSSNHPPSLRPSMPGPSSRSPERQGSEKKMPPLRPERPTAETLSPRFLDQFSSEPAGMPTGSAVPPPRPGFSSENRSKTFPVVQGDPMEPHASQGLARSPTEPTPTAQDRRPSLAGASRSEPSFVPQARHPPRGQSRDASRIDYRMLDAPPVPKALQSHRRDSFHTPSESSSSDTSSSADNSNGSTGPSLVGSAASSMDNSSPLSYEPAQYGEEQAMRVAGLNVRGQKPGMRAEQPTQRSPPRSRVPAVPARAVSPPLEQEPALPTLGHWPLESPMDPAMENFRLQEAGYMAAGKPQAPDSPTFAPPSSGLVPPSFGAADYDPFRPISPQPQRPQQTRTRSKTNTSPQPNAFNAGVPSRSKTPEPGKSPNALYSAPQAPPMPPTASRPRLARRQTSTKPTCRGCNQQIEGKSVKAADGRLTGRWHKTCFVCRGCRQPFTTADFYVIADQPYCEQHYHEKNGSLCAGCHRGIEGQYLEASTSRASGASSGGGAGANERKFHPRCFTCVDCRAVLAEDYFEISGRVYCERHALAAMRSQARVVGGSFAGGLAPPGTGGGSNLRAERRTTKLMMMMM